MRCICVYTGSNPGNRLEYQLAAKAMGKELVTRGLTLVYGGGRVGLMGILADTVLAEGGEVIGVMPRALFPSEVAYNTQGITFHEVGSMHERKALMADLSDGFVALPGGLGTYDELFEILTWAQLGIHRKPVGLLNVDGYFDPLLALIEHTITEGFLRPTHAHLLMYKDHPADLLDDLAAYIPPPPKSKWSELPPR
jgi:uncharacterized protein (TIGR00730 family)